jgi:hypothetical protein
MKWTNRSICGWLVASLVLLPAHAVHADTIATDQVLAKTSAQERRQVVLTYLSRPEVAVQLRAFGVPRHIAEQRVAAMTEDEVDALAGKLDSLPAGGGVSFIFVVGTFAFLIYWYIWAQSK